MIKAAIQFCLFSLLSGVIGCKDFNTSKEYIAKQEHKKTAIVKEKWHWGHKEKQNGSAGYAQVVKVGHTIYISGVPTGDLSPRGITELYKTLGKCLNAFGASSKDVVKETLYTTDMETMKKYNDSRKEFYKGDFPAATWVQVSRLYEADSKLEVELIAQLKDRED